MTNVLKKDPLAKAFGLVKKPATPAETTPQAPTLDDAAKNRDQFDRIRKRRGVLANVFGGATASSTPSVGIKQLLGS